MAEIIRVEDLIIDYPGDEERPDFRAVDGVSFSIEKGSFVSIIGRNGSGKSTLAKSFNALLLPTSGDVYIAGYNTKDEAHLWDIRQSAGMVFQNPDNQLVSAIVEDDVAFGPENMGVEPSEIRRRVDDSLRAVDMYEYRTKAPHMLSGGQKQRIAIAGVIAMKPEIIIFDEPTAMLDPKGRKEVLKIISMLHDEGITVILITHFMEEAAAGDRVLIMNEGRITADGTPSEIFARRKVIEDAGLEMPLAADIAERLRNMGAEIPSDILSTEELVEAICRLK